MVITVHHCINYLYFTCQVKLANFFFFSILSNYLPNLERSMLTHFPLVLISLKCLGEQLYVQLGSNNFYWLCNYKVIKVMLNLE